MSSRKSLPSRRVRRPVRRPQVMALTRSIAPAHIVRTLRYCQQFGSTGTGTAPSVQQFRLNDCYDPDYTGTGHQPMGFDQMMTLYATFRVLSTRVKCAAVHYSAPAANNPQPSFNGVMGFFARPNDTAAITTLYQGLEQPGGVFTLIPNGGVGHLESNIDHATAFGVSRQQYIADNEFVGTATGSPQRWVVGTFYHASASPGVYAASIFLTLQLELTVRFEGPLILGTS